MNTSVIDSISEARRVATHQNLRFSSGGDDVWRMMLMEIVK